MTGIGDISTTARDVVSSSAYCLVCYQKARLSSLLVSTGPASMAGVSAQEVESNADGRNVPIINHNYQYQRHQRFSSVMSESNKQRHLGAKVHERLARAQEKTDRQRQIAEEWSEHLLRKSAIARNELDEGRFGNASNQSVCKRFWDKLHQGHKNSLESFIRKNFDSFERSVIKHGLDGQELQATRTSPRHHVNITSKLNKIDNANLRWLSFRRRTRQIITTSCISWGYLSALHHNIQYCV